MRSVAAFGEGPGEAIHLLTRLPCVQVARCGLDVRVSHGSLDLRHRHTGGGQQRSVGVAQVVEAQRPQSSGVARALEAARSAEASSVRPR